MRFLRGLLRMGMVVALMSSVAMNVGLLGFAGFARFVSGALASAGHHTPFERMRRDVVDKSRTIDRQTSVLEERNREMGAKDRAIAEKDRRLVKRTQALKERDRMLTAYRSSAKRHAGRVAKRVTAGAARNVTAIFGESIPFYGVAVAVGVTGWELYDACETMKDMRAMSADLEVDADLDAEVTSVCGLQVPSRDEITDAIYSSPGDIWKNLKKMDLDLPELDWPPTWLATPVIKEAP